MTGKVLEPDLVWTGTEFRPKRVVEIDETGMIARVGAPDGKPTTRMKGVALLPGFVNAHSHAFQRGLRGIGESFTAGAGTGDFWTWREVMYRLVESVDRQDMYDLSRKAFDEMLAAGITTVGEFHYLHHHSATRDYAFDSTVLEAAREAGIRLVLLNAFYRMGGFGQQLKSEQQRFRSDSVSEFLGNMDSLRAHVTGNQQLGVVAHSVRAVPVADIIELHRGARDRDLPFHLHIEEQRREIEECIHATGKTPMRLLLDAIEDATAVTAVHATHTDADDLGEFLRRGGAVCVCPLTEGNLGDGIPGAHITAAELVCLGTDSNERIDMFEEMRWLEYGQRLRGEMRGAFRDDTGEVAPRLLRAATVVGAASLSVSAGSIAVGKSADFCAVKLNHPTLRGIEPRGLASALVFGCDASVVDSTWVGGKRVF